MVVSTTCSVLSRSIYFKGTRATGWQLGHLFNFSSVWKALLPPASLVRAWQVLWDLSLRPGKNPFDNGLCSSPWLGCEEARWVIGEGASPDYLLISILPDD